MRSTSSANQMFLKSALEKILTEKDVRRKENAQLKKACETSIEQLKPLGEKGSANGVVPSRERIIDAESHLLPFELACASHSPKIINIALDCVQKLVSYGHINGVNPDKSNPDRTVSDRIVEIICSAFEKERADETVLLQILKAILAIVLSNECPVHEKSLLDTVRICFTIYLVTKSPINEATARGSLTQIINAVFSRMEKAGEEKDDSRIVREVVDSLVHAVALPENRASSEAGGGSTIGDSDFLLDDFSNVHQKDAFLVFRALCVLSQKGEGDQSDPKDTHLRSKVFALEMLLGVLQHSGNVLQNSLPFVHLIKRSLCVTLSNNAVSPIISVFEKSLAIFVELVDKFKQHLKIQIEVFFKEMIISMLDSTSCSYEHRWVLLNTVAKIISSPQALVELYVNYDCDLTGFNIFEHLVGVISRTTQTPVSEVPLQRERDRKMRLLGLQCLVDIMKCQVEWYLSCESADNVSREGEGEEDPLALLELTKQRKDRMEQGIFLFARKAKEGIAFLQEHGFVGTDPVDIAQFLLTEERLDKTVVGDYLGDANEFNKKVMYAYVDDMDFSSLDMVSSLRAFLEKFRLPGEAQKIDRLMEKFASRYCECNPSLGFFASADTAYVLAYSVILLTTDLHSAQVRNKMTKDQYVSMNRGINNGADLPREILDAIYDDIAKNEIKMKAGAAQLLKSGGRKTDARLEMAAMSETATALMESASRSDALFVAARHQQHVRPMFEQSWTCALAAFSLGLQQSDDAGEWRLCLQGFRLGIRMATLLDGAAVERDAFIQALGRFTLLTQRASMAEMREKNIEAIKLMLLIGAECGDQLKENWIDVLKCISQLELVSLIGTGLRSSNGLPSHSTQSSARYVAKSTGQDEKMLSSLQTTLTETASQAVVVAVDRIFHNSFRLSADAVVDFVTALCQVSSQELVLPSGPRMFLLSKIVEVALYNMGRIRLEWSRIWAVIGDHLKNAGCNDNETVSHFSVDALRQLAIKFMEKGELPNYRFQKEFLRPFEVIMSRNGSAATRELVIACTTLMVDGHPGRIKSGWMNLFSIWTIAAGDTHVDIVEAAFRAMSKAVEGQFKDNFASVLDAFQEAQKCLAEFACNGNIPDMSMDAIRLIRLCAECVAKNEEVIVESPWEDKFSMTGHQRIWMRGWLPIFFELSNIINRCKLDIRTRSLTVMFEILKSHGDSLKADWWKDLFGVIFRIFDHTKMDDSRADKKEWMVTTCNHAMYALVDIFTQFFPAIGPPLLPELYDQLALCVRQKNEQLARSAVSCIENVVILNAEHFDEFLWNKTTDLICSIFKSTLPDKLLTWRPERINGFGKSNEKEEEEGERERAVMGDDEFGDAITMCIVQSDMVEAVSSIVIGKDDRAGLFSTIPPPLLLRLCHSLIQSQALAKSFNANNGQRTLLWKAGLRGSAKPNLSRQETRSLSTLLSILLKLLLDERAEGMRVEVASLLSSSVHEALSAFASSESESRRAALSPVLSRLLEECLSLPRPLLLSSLGGHFPRLLCDLVLTAESPDLRQHLCELLKVFCCK